jgi:outer membrane receptor protein involved in Fe transport
MVEGIMKTKCVGVMVLSAIAGTVLAQDGAADQASEELETVVVTGTRIEVSGFTAPTPVRVLGQELIEARNPIDATELVRGVPAVTIGGSTAAGVGNASSAGQGFLNLRLGTGSSRTLTLVDGHRPGATSTGGQFDINTIPTFLIARAEFVTGGASAAYGSDAVTGVGNFVLKDRLEGLSGGVSYGRSEHGDYVTENGSFAFGTDFGNRVHFMIGADVSNNSGIDSMYDREWGRREPGLYAYGAATGSGLRAGRPASEWVYGYEIANRTPGGIITACGATPCPASLANVAFTASGTPYTLVKGVTSSGGAFMYGTDANYGNASASYFNVSVPYKRRTVLARLTFDLTDDTNLRLQAWAGGNSAQSKQNINQSAITIRNTDPAWAYFLATGVNPGSATQVTVGRTSTDLGAYYTAQEVDYLAPMASLTGKVFGDWKWDAYYQRSQTKTRGSNTGLRTADINAAFSGCSPTSLATASVVTAGSTVLTGTGTSSTPGCVPFNIFGVGNASAAAYNYLQQYQQGTLFTYTQDTAEFSMSGEALSTWAGPMAWATGAAWRRDELSLALKDDSANFALRSPNGTVSSYGFVTGNYTAYGSGRSVKEASVEANAPLAKELPLIKSLDLNTAYRYATYSDSSSFSTWKVGLVWDISDEYRVRATRSRDMRAPSLFEQYGNGGYSIQNVSNPVTGVTDTNVVVYGKTPSPNLQPEIAFTTTFGVVFQPAWVPGLRVSLDYYKIRIPGAISDLMAGQRIQGCLLYNIAQACEGLTFAPNTQRVTEIRSSSINASLLETRGEDFEISYRIPADLFGGRITTSLMVTHIEENKTTNVFGTSESTAPKWNGLMLVSYAKGPFSTTFELTANSKQWYSNTAVGPDDPQYYQTVTSSVCPGGTTAAPTQCPWYMIASNSVSQNEFGGTAKLNWSAQYDFDLRSLQLTGFVGINNVLDRDPSPFILGLGGGAGAGGGGDVVGRSYRAGIRFNF